MNPSAPPDRRARARRRARDRGQASIEWLAVVALVAALLALGAGLAQADGVGRRVTRELARALCLVGDGDCHRDQEPCVVTADAARSSWSGAVAIVRLGHDRLAVVERRSDGTFAVTVQRSVSGGAEGSAGLKLSAHVGGIDVSAGGTVTASLLAQLDGARTWLAGSAAEAAAILAAGGAERAPDLTSSGGAWLSSVGASVGADALVHLDAGSARLTFDQHAGTITDHRTGRRTVYVDAATSASASTLDGVLGVATADARELYAVELSPTGRPLALKITATGAADGSHALPAAVQPVAGRLAAPGADRYEVTATLDLSDAEALAAASGLLDAIAHRRGRAAPSAALRRLVAARGTIEARLLATRQTSDQTGLEATVLAATVGLGHTTEQREQRLLAAVSRGLDGQWIVREDCT
jgi:hypothetical protein